jgi:hypothetical protein
MAPNPDFQLLESATWIPGSRSAIWSASTASRCSSCRRRHCSSAARSSPAGASAQAARPCRRACTFALLLLLEAATLGVFCALDTILFFFCWEFTLLPLVLPGQPVGRRQRPAGSGSALFPGHAGRRRAAAVRPAGRRLRPCRGRRTGFDLPTLLATPLPEHNAVRGVPAAARRLWRQGAAGTPAHLAAVDGHGGTGGGDGSCSSASSSAPTG